MKIISIVGIRGSGKTTAAENIIKCLKERNLRVAGVKHINCPNFSIEECGKSNTWRHKQAGADIVVAHGSKETSFIHSAKVTENEIFSELNGQVDWVVFEGDYCSRVPLIVCGHEEEDTAERINERTIAVSGRYGAKCSELKGIPAFDVTENAEALTEYIMEKAWDVTLPVEQDPLPLYAMWFCRHACLKNCGEALPPAEEILNMASPETQTEKKHVFLTGAKQVGKSTAIRKALEESGVKYAGYRTLPMFLGSERKAFYMHAEGMEVPAPFENDVIINVRTEAKKSIPVTESFETFGCEILKKAREEADIILLDELGKMENEAHNFRAEVKKCLDEKIVIGVIQKIDSKMMDMLKLRPDVEIIEVNEQNRDTIPAILVENLLKN